MPDEIEEELEIIEERNKEIEPNIELALSINEPIKKLLYKKPVVISKSAKIIEAINLFNEKGIGCVLVVDEKTGKLTGIFTEHDVIKKLINDGLDLYKEKLEKHMTINPDSLQLTDPIAYALNRMSAGGYRHIPIVDEKNIPVGLLSIKDIIDHLADYYSNEILNLPPSPHAKQKSQEGG